MGGLLQGKGGSMLTSVEHGARAPAIIGAHPSPWVAEMSQYKIPARSRSALATGQPISAPLRGSHHGDGVEAAGGVRLRNNLYMEYTPIKDVTAVETLPATGQRLRPAQDSY